MTAPFTTAEYQARVARVKARMRAAGIEVLLCSSPGNMNWLTGYDGWSFYVHQFVAVALDAEEPMWLGRGIDIAGARHTAWLSDDNIRGYGDEHLQARDNHPVKFVAGVFAEKGWDGRRIGVEMDDFYFTGLALDELRKALPGAQILDADFLVDWARIVKSPAEIGYMREASRIVEAATRAALDTIAPGVRQCDAVAKVYEAQIRGTPEFGGDYTAAVASMPAGAAAAAPHLTWTDAPYEANQAVNMELGGCRHRYHSAMCRTVQLGKPPQKLVDLAALVVEGFHVALDAMRPGVECQAVEVAWRKVIAREGLEKPTRMGYSIGLNYPPDWGERTASMRPGDTTVLAPGMTFHLIPAMWFDDWGFILSETVLVTETGAESLNYFPRQLFIKD
jgi:ectoine hydrolase